MSKPRRPERDEKKWVTRSLSLPVQDCLSHPWPEFMRILHAAWRHSTDLANWASHTLALNDVVRVPGMKQLPPMPPVYLYGMAFGVKKSGLAPRYDGHEAWDGAKIAAATLLRKVERKYRQERGKVIWRRERRTPEFLYPYPFPVHQQAWVPGFTERNRPMVLLSLPGGRVSLRLRDGPEFASRLKTFRAIVDGDVAQQELSLCRQRAGTHGHGHAAPQRPAGGDRVTYRVMARIAHRFEVADRDDGPVASVRTGAGTETDPFIAVVVGDREPWVLSGAEVRGFIVAHRAFLDRMSEDLKFEKRWPRGKRRRMLRRLARGCDKQGRRMRSFMQMTAAMVCGCAARQGCGAVRYDSTDRSFVTRDFPWFRLEEHLQDKCDELGLAFDSVAASGADVEEAAAPENDVTTEGDSGNGSCR